MMGLERLWPGIVDLWCEWTHGGGHIERDPSGRVNWQCNRCGRWAQPVPIEDENARTTLDEWLAIQQRNAEVVRLERDHR